MNNNDWLQVARITLQKNPQVANTPLGRELANIIETGDIKHGEEVANNLLRTNNATKEEVLSNAPSFFQSMMRR